MYFSVIFGSSQSQAKTPIEKRNIVICRIFFHNWWQRFRLYPAGLDCTAQFQANKTKVKIPEMFEVHENQALTIAVSCNTYLFVLLISFPKYIMIKFNSFSIFQFLFR